MKPIVVFVLVAAIPLAVVAANAKTVTTSTSTQERMTSGVAGPVASAETAQKKAAKKSQAKKQAAPSDDQLRTNATQGHP